MTDKPNPQPNKQDKLDKLNSLSEKAEKLNRIQGKISSRDSLLMGIPSGSLDKIMHKTHSINDIAHMMKATSDHFKKLLPQSPFKGIENLPDNIKNLYKPFTIDNSFYQNNDILNSILGSQYSFLERQSYMINFISETLSSDYLFSKNLNPELYGLTENLKDLFGKGILSSTASVFDHPDLDISDLEDKIEKTLQEEETLLKSEDFTNELREKFDKDYASTYKLGERMEQEGTFLFYRLMNNYNISAQAARNFVQMVMWALGIYISVLAKELISSKKEDRKSNTTHIHNTYNNPVYITVNETDTVFVKTPVYRRSSDKTKRHATIPSDSIVSVFKQKGVYSLVETVIDSTNSDERRIVRGWIKNDSLKNKASN